MDVIFLAHKRFRCHQSSFFWNPPRAPSSNQLRQNPQLRRQNAPIFFQSSSHPSKSLMAVLKFSWHGRYRPYFLLRGRHLLKCSQAAPSWLDSKSRRAIAKSVYLKGEIQIRTTQEKDTESFFFKDTWWKQRQIWCAYSGKINVLSKIFLVESRNFPRIVSKASDKCPFAISKRCIDSENSRSPSGFLANNLLAV